MYKHHRLEYYNHRRRLISLLLINYATLCLLLFIFVGGFSLTYCLAEQQEISDTSGAFFPPEEGSEHSGYCSFYVYGFRNARHGSKVKAYQTMIFCGLNFI